MSSAAALGLPPRMSVAEFLVWDNGDPSGRLWQLVDGEPMAMAPASETHGRIQAELTVLIGLHLRRIGSPCAVVVTPGVVPRARATDNVRVPDLAVTCAPPAVGPSVRDPVLLVEILSPSNFAKTRLNVWSYISIPSVTEILMVDSVTIGAELLRRMDDKSWPEQPAVLGADDALELRSIGFSVTLREIYRTTALV
ncbi:MAG: Uma2 family endonuclease [Acidisphaera sp.]|nr:Uma2 family endonuclease [Acidisphaera sp.]